MASGRLTARFGPRLPMIAGLSLAAAGTVVLARGTRHVAGPAPRRPVLLGLVSLAMPAMTAVVVGAAGREHAGVASGVLNAARQAGGALGVACSAPCSAPATPDVNLHVPLLVATGGYLIAVALAWVTITDRTTKLNHPSASTRSAVGGQPGRRRPGREGSRCQAYHADFFFLASSGHRQRAVERRSRPRIPRISRVRGRRRSGLPCRRRRVAAARPAPPPARAAR